MTENDDFWDDLLAHIRQRVLVPVAGPDLSIVTVSDRSSQTLSELIGHELVKRYNLDVSPESVSMVEAVAAFLRERGRDESERLYRVINDIISEFDDQQCAPLRELAAITDLRLLVSTSPDGLLARAVNDVRFNGKPLARELVFSPTQSTEQQARDAHAPWENDTVILRLFGQAASTPQYAIHDEDLLEWLHSLSSGAGSLPEWITYSLKHQPLLFIGCHLPDWLGRFLLRLSSHTRLSLESKQFFFVESPASKEPTLSSFFSTYCRRAQVQQLEMKPDAFVTELRARWEAQSTIRRHSAQAVGNTFQLAPSTIFISYIREDVAVARRLHDAIAALGGDVWLDERRLRPGDAWEVEILGLIRKEVRLFIPIISANTERQEEGYIFREWREAVVRSHSIPRRRFIVPVVVDDEYNGDLRWYRHVPEDFGQFQFGHAPTGEPDAGLRSLLVEEIRAMRRVGAA